MNARGARAAVRFLQARLCPDAVVPVSDGDLLARFVAHRDNASLEALVLRHGPMVWGVCLRTLRDHHDAEDAFQATFLVLARKAAAVSPPDRVGNWLHGVARQTALKARATRAKRRTREGSMALAAEPAAHPGVAAELAECLDAELSRLPAKYRAPLVLCDLEGKTHGEAAAHLGWPVGTVSGRLSRAKALLAERLSRRGVLAGVTLAVVLDQARAAAMASLPVRLLTATAAISTEAVALSREVVQAMFLAKLKTAAAAILACALLGAGLWQTHTRAGDKPRLAPSSGGKAVTYRVVVTEVIRDEGTLVAQVAIQVRPGAKLEVVTDKEKRGTSSLSLTSEAADPKGPVNLQLVLMADHVQAEWKGGSTNAVKFLLGHKIGGISGTSSETVPMPADARLLADVVKVPIKTGDYEYDKPTQLATFNGVTYTLQVAKPK